MSHDTNVKSGPPSKNAENQDSATLTRSQPATTEEIEARVRRDGDPFDETRRSRGETV